MKNIIAFIIAINVVIAVEQSIQTHVPYTEDMAELIFEYYHSYKHIKRLSLFFCNDPIAEQRDPAQSNIRSVNMQQIVKQLMVSGKFAIKGVRNIDGVITYGAGDKANYTTIESINLIGMLECGDFKQGVVLDLRCRQSDYILQQVKQPICIYHQRPFIHRRLDYFTFDSYV